MKDFNRKELSGIIDLAQAQAGINGLNTLWQNAYLEMARAADRLDAMMARSEAKVVE